MQNMEGDDLLLFGLYVLGLHFRLLLYIHQILIAKNIRFLHQMKFSTARKKEPEGLVSVIDEVLTFLIKIKSF